MPKIGNLIEKQAKMRLQENSTKRKIRKKIKKDQGGKSEKTSPK